MAAEVVEFAIVDSPLGNGPQGESSFLNQRENGEFGNRKFEGIMKVDDSVIVVSNGDETVKVITNRILDSAEEWLVPEQTQPFYFIKHRMYDDPAIKTKIDLADKEIRKRNKVRFQLAGELKTKRAHRAELITCLKSLQNEEKQYRAILNEKAKEIKPLQQTLQKLSNADSSSGCGISSSEKELDELRIKQLKGTREKVMSEAATKAKIQDSLGQKDAIHDQLKLLASDLDEIRKEHQAVASKVKKLDDELEAINGDITILQDEMNTVTEKRDNAVARIKDLRSQNAHENSSFFECRKVISLAKNYALSKDTKALGDLWGTEVENFMSQWNNSKRFRDDYVERISPSFDNRQLSRDGRMLIIPDEKQSVEVEVKASSKLENFANVDAKRGNQDLNFVVYQDTSPIKKAQKSVHEEVTSSECNLDHSDVAEKLPKSENPEKNLPANDEVDVEKLKELKREEEIAKAKQAMERKKRMAEKAAAKAALKAQKEAERKNKEREKKAKKKGNASVMIPGEDLDEEYGPAAEQEKDEETVVETIAPVQEKVQKEVYVRHRIKQKAPDAIPKVILKRRRSSNFWVWVTAAAIFFFFVMLAILGYQSLP